MLFNSYEFIFLFLPITLIGFYLLGRRSQRIANAWLVLASLFFYGWWKPSDVVLILISILLNYYIGTLIAKNRFSKSSLAKSLLCLGIVINLGGLFYFKYSTFLLSNFNTLFSLDWTIFYIVLPLGISFFTFTQIAFLIDTHRGKAAEYNFIDYCLFVTFFPHLFAGPVLHHGEMMPQFSKPDAYKLHYENFSVGLTIFVIGLFKKVILADSIASYVSPVFDAANHQGSMGFYESWIASIAYSLQLYFDFSGYSDMAIGLSRLIGIHLPLNFNSPYKSVNIIDFWKRWHLTLSRFLREYLYIPLGGNRRGKIRRHINLFITMLLGGLWHGANWTFVIWGMLHGIYLIINHLWQELKEKLGISSNSRLLKGLSILVTYLAVVFAWTWFRADNVQAGISMIRGMLGLNGITLPNLWLVHSSIVGTWLGKHGVTFINHPVYNGLNELLWTLPLLAIAWFLPNTQEVMSSYQSYFNSEKKILSTTRWTWHPTFRWAFFCFSISLLSLVNISKVSTFLYFQF